LLTRFRGQRCQFCRDHYGFTYPEVDHLRETFMGFDADRSGELKNAEMIMLLDSVFTEMSTDPNFRPTILSTLKEIDADGSGSLDFHDFLRLMRKCTEMNTQARFDKEKQVLSETQFSPHEVHEFRQLFLACDVNGDQELSFQEFKKMIASICPMGDKNTAALSSMFYKATARQERVQGRRDHADFPEFLWLLHHLMDNNFGGMRDILEANFGGKMDKNAVERRNGDTFSRQSSNNDDRDAKHIS